MAEDPRAQETARPSGRARLVRMAVVFVLVAAAAALLGRFGTGIDSGPAVDVDQSGPVGMIEVIG